MVMFSNTARMTGFSGLDVQSMVHQMMIAESGRLNRMRQDRQVNMWRQQSYRGVNTQLRSFQDRFLSVTAPQSLQMSSVMNPRGSTVAGAGGASTNARVNANSDASLGMHHVEVLSIAMAQRFQVAAPTGSRAITAREAFDPSNLRAGDSFRITLNNGSLRTIEFTAEQVAAIQAAPDSNQALLAHINTRLESEFGSVLGEPRVVASMVDGRLSIDTHLPSDRVVITEGAAAPARRAVTNFELSRDNLMELRGQPIRLSINDIDVNFTFNVPDSDLEGLTEIEQRDVLRARFIQNVNTALTNATAPNIRAEIDNDVLVFRGTGTTRDVNITIRHIDNTDTENVEIRDLFPTVELSGASSLTALGGITSGAQNTLGGANSIGNIFDTSFFVNVYDSDGDFSHRAFEFTVNGRNFILREDMTVNQMINAVNSANVGARLEFDNLSGNFTLRATAAGDSGRISTTGAQGLGEFGAMLGFENGTEIAGQDAHIRINGVDVVRDSNAFTIQGLTFDLNGLNGEVINGTVTTAGVPYNFTVEVTTDRESVRENILDFVIQYNALVRELRDLRAQARPRSHGSFYNPLTEEQRRSMTDSEIARWEEQAQTGLLHRSQIIEQTLVEMRRAFNETSVNITGHPQVETLRLFHFGLEHNRGGFLTINEERLESALNQFETDDVASIFAELGSGLNAAVSRTAGPAGRIRDMAGNEVFSRSLLDRRIQDLERRAMREEERLARREAQLFRQFNRMEQAMTHSNSQLDFLFQMMGM